MSIQKLIDQTHQAIRKVEQHHAPIDTELADLYKDDLNDFVGCILSLIYKYKEKINTGNVLLSHTSLPCSTIGAVELNFRVRYGNGCDLFAIITRLFSAFNIHRISSSASVVQSVTYLSTLLPSLHCFLELLVS